MTDKQNRANRQNALKSSGPTSVEGKARSSKNAQKHGLLSRDLIVAGESREEFDTLLSQIFDEYRPVGLVEQALTEKVAVTLWRQKRLIRAESAKIALNREIAPLALAAQIATKLNLTHTEVLPHFKIAEVQIRWSISELEIMCQELEKIYKSPGSLSGKSHWNQLSANLQKHVQDEAIEAGLDIDGLVTQYGGWAKWLTIAKDYFQLALKDKQVRRIKILVEEAALLDASQETTQRYQVALDNELVKSLKALREAQQWRMDRALLEGQVVGEEKP